MILIIVILLIGLFFSSKVKCPVIPSNSNSFIALATASLSVVPAFSIAAFKIYAAS